VRGAVLVGAVVFNPWKSVHLPVILLLPKMQGTCRVEYHPVYGENPIRSEGMNIAMCRNMAKAQGLYGDDVDRAVAWAWYCGSVRKEFEIAEEGLVFWRAIRDVRRGQDLPGCGTPYKDAMRHLGNGDVLEFIGHKRPSVEDCHRSKEALRLAICGLSKLGRRLILARLRGITRQRLQRYARVGQETVKQAERAFLSRFKLFF